MKNSMLLQLRQLRQLCDLTRAERLARQILAQHSPRGALDGQLLYFRIPFAKILIETTIFFPHIVEHVDHCS